jgi:alpha-glucoside transport system permease protein
MSPLAPRRAGAPARVLQRVPLHAVVLLVCLVWTVPLAGLLVSSFRPASAVAQSGWWTAGAHPLQFTLANYQQVLTANNMGQSFINSLLVAVPATVLPILAAAFAAYALAWMRFRGRGWIFLATVALLVVPLQVTLIPVLRLFTSVGLTGTFPAVWLAHAAYGLPFGVYLLRTFFGLLPREMLESAEVDGAGHWTVFLRLVLPTSLPALASLAIFQFLWVWNDLLVSLVYLGGQPSVAPMTLTIANLVNSLGQGWQLLTAAAFVSMALPLLLFFALQRYFVAGMLAGSVKG